MTAEERAAIMAANPPTIEGVHGAHAYFDWGWKGCGFGQLSFSVNAKTGEINCSNECMGREKVRAILHALADHIADKCVLDCDPETHPAFTRNEEDNEWAQTVLRSRAFTNGER